jgi:signal transduction histidine kinase
MLSLQDIRNELDEKELDSWMKLIRVLMHEIMNSIAPITSLSESLCKYYMIEGHVARPDELTEATINTTLRGLNVIREQGNGMMQFVESYRKLTRLPKPELKAFRVFDLLERIKILYSSLANSEKVKLMISVNPPSIELLADENLVSQVLINLVKNALEANDNLDGKIHIYTGLNSDHRLEIRVADNGKGIPDEIIGQIFVPFFTTRENGSGIGLSLSRQIMRLHGGTLQVRSNPGKETVFNMVF